MVEDSVPKLLLIGCGPYAQRAYLPCFKEPHDSVASLVGVIETAAALGTTRAVLASSGLGDVPVRAVGVDTQGSVLRDFVRDTGAEGVIISSQSESHDAYAASALREGLHVLVDKPPIVVQNSSTDPQRAKEIVTRFSKLSELYAQARAVNSSLVFCVAVQRRFDTPFTFMKSRVGAVFEQTGHPVSFIDVVKSDGQFRTPKEMLDVNYHGFSRGYGVLSHTGYHLLDVLPWLLEAAQHSDKRITHARVVSDFVRPYDVAGQLGKEELRWLLGDKTDEHTAVGEVDLERLRSMGEVDAHVGITFYSGDAKITRANISVIHHGFSRRGQVLGDDLYRGSGRVKQEQWLIQQGPFQSIKYVASEAGMMGVPAAPFIRGRVDLSVHPSLPQPKRTTVPIFRQRSPNVPTEPLPKMPDMARRVIVEEFVQAIRGEIPRGKLTSDFLLHKNTNALFSAAYESAAREYNNENPLVVVDLDF